MGFIDMNVYQVVGPDGRPVMGGVWTSSVRCAAASALYRGSTDVRGVPVNDAQAPYWVGTPTGAAAGSPGHVTPLGADLPADLAATRFGAQPGNPVEPGGLIADPQTAWTEGQYIVLTDNSHAYWDGDSWEQSEAPSAPVTSGATAGDPGTFTPSGGDVPADLAAMSGITADPDTAWTVGQHVVLGDDSHAYWDGDSWEEGEAPQVAIGATTGHPGAFTPTGAGAPADLAAMSTIVASPHGRWVVGDYVVVGDESHTYWDGNSWNVGGSPNVAFAGVNGSFFAATPADLAALSAVLAAPAAAWTAGEYVTLVDDSHAYWSGTAWVAGEAS